MNRCDRCRSETLTLMMSVFNTEMCCFDCIDKEKQHPKYDEACRAEIEATMNLDFNYPGIGKPDDL